MTNTNTPSTPTPPPSIGKIGPYTVFVTPPATPSPKPSPTPAAPSFIAVPIPKTAPSPSPPVQLPPIQYPSSPVDRFAFLRNALVKLQHVHASVDEYMANLLGLDQSKYQWALDDYYEAKGVEKGDALIKEVSNKSQTV